MQVRNVISSIFRRWYILLVGLALTAAGCFVLQSSTPNTYKAQASLVLLPSVQSVGERGNPYLGLGGMNEALDILTRKMSSEEFKEKIRLESGTDSYTAAPDRGTSGAILVITASSDASDQTMKILGTVVDQVPVALNELQDVLGVPDASRISVMKLLEDRTAIPEAKARTQMLLVAGAGGAALTLITTVLLDSLLLRRRTKRLEKREATDPADSPKRMGKPSKRRKTGMADGEQITPDTAGEETLPALVTVGDRPAPDLESDDQATAATTLHTTHRPG
ncbi:hypothetical protein [Paenarthrobacter ureafaciens]|jgi:hypothetical protein|uniref:hypothetical protein n=1 Tax=Paenarthrobacter ureafaciens TaxID=37931 RepID=UPI001FB2EF00|nr:hypothetical protein [Paenarthrobacter ureafaciens]UOD79536.1 hypothetical protein MQZ73_10190 [Paenarthrobacter ureafaciens]WNZ02890.1 hypothetical protein PVT25_14745 [Paenarthrobacter ureafaciens]